MRTKRIQKMMEGLKATGSDKTNREGYADTENLAYREKEETQLRGLSQGNIVKTATRAEDFKRKLVTIFVTSCQ